VNDIAVIQIGSKQYKVKEGDRILVERLKDKKPNDKLELVDLLSNRQIIASVLGERKGKKIAILKFKPRKRYRRKIGHRQTYTELQITFRNKASQLKTNKIKGQVGEKNN